MYLTRVEFLKIGRGSAFSSRLHRSGQHRLPMSRIVPHAAGSKQLDSGRSAGLTSVPAKRLDDHERLRQRIVIGYRQMNGAPHAVRRHLLEALGRPAGQLHGGLAARQVHNAHVPPEHASRQPCSKCLGASLLRREPLGVGSRTQGPAIRLGPLDIRKAAPDETIAVTFEGLLDPPDVNQITANSDDHALFALSAVRSALAAASSRSRALARAASLDLRCV
ncbi:hypothetical protein HOE425_330162 [Hoeflea sp. EC-HK425]|nr:hypothetical protein HOE425_330162 [Hoeflea sp. EC-HK425]